MDTEAQVDTGSVTTEESLRRSVIFDRIVPIVAGVLIIGLLALLTFSLLGPDIGAGGRSGVAINENGALVNIEPRPADDFNLTLFDGSSLRLSELRGQIVVVNFWASWCPPCREGAPQLEAAWQDLRDEGVIFVGVDVWDDRDDALAFIAEFGVSYPNGPDDGAIAVDYGVTGIPETFIIDREGQLAAKFVGPVTLGQLSETVRALDR